MYPTLALIREEKKPVDRRVALTPIQCKGLLERYPGLQILVQPSPDRSYKDENYQTAGAIIKEDLSEADILLGIKEVPSASLLPNKQYLFFSHTIKKQPYNREMLQKILEKNITLTDYEVLTWEKGSRIIGFGRFAGIVGTHNGLWTWGKKYKSFDLKRAHECYDYAELLGSYSGIELPAIKIALCGDGRVAHGAMELMEKVGIREVTNRAYIYEQFDGPVYCHLRPDQLYESSDHRPYDKAYFYHNPEKYFSVFNLYYPVTDLMINAIYWNERIPRHFSLDEMQSANFNIKVIADITCDINGSIPSTTRATTIADPVYGWNRFTKKEEAPFLKNTVDMMTVGNLPCEIPRDASEEFGELLSTYVIPLLLEKDKDGIIERATIAKNGKLCERYAYLEEFVKK